MQKSDFTPKWEDVNNAVDKAMEQYCLYKDKCLQRDKIIVVNYSVPSYQRRLYIIDVITGEMIENHHVSHGEGSSDTNNRALAVRFSNTIGSLQTSLGAMVTAETYMGKHGFSMRLNGLEKGVNDNVRRRAIVMHSAPYVTDAFILNTGRAGQSQGCLALDPAISNSVIQNTKNGVFFYAYYK